MEKDLKTKNVDTDTNTNTQQQQQQQQTPQQQPRPQQTQLKAKQHKQHKQHAPHKQLHTLHLEAPNIATGQDGGTDGSASSKAKAVVHPSTTGATGPVCADRGKKSRRLGPGRGKGKGNAPPVGIAGAENPRTPDTKGGSQGFRADSLEAIEMMADAEVHSAKISGSSKRRVAALIKAGKEYIQAKRQVLRDNFNRWVQHTSKAAKRPRSEGESPQQWQPAKKAKARAGEQSYSEALSFVKVAIVQEGYPEAQLAPERLTAIQYAVLKEYDQIPKGSMQVRLAKCMYRPGFVLATCADQISAEWLRDIVPKLRPWKGAKLLPLLGEDIPRPETAVVFIPDEQGNSLEADIVLRRLEVGNDKWRTDNWKVWGCKPVEGGRVWTFSMDRASIDELRRLNMSSFFGWGQIKFRVKTPKYKGPEEARSSRDEEELVTKATGPDKDSDNESSPGGQSGLEGEMEALSNALSVLPTCEGYPKEEGVEAMEISMGDLPCGSGSLPQRPKGQGRMIKSAETRGGVLETQDVAPPTSDALHGT
uniref:DUF4780 domain-containing protein n=1 Tax=Rhodnius prolixus TaxID=13249 RepID=T1HKL4_RHOPR